MSAGVWKMPISNLLIHGLYKQTIYLGEAKEIDFFKETLWNDISFGILFCMKQSIPQIMISFFWPIVGQTISAVG